MTGPRPGGNALRRLRPRPRPLGSEAARADAGAALALTIFLIMLIGVFSLSIAAAVLVQVRPTQVAQKNLRTIGAAEAGIAVGLNRVRAANDGSGNGVLASLPCTLTTSAVLSGPVAPSITGSPQYTVTIRYYLADPSQQSSTWRNSNALVCTSGHPSQVPLYALLESYGSAAAVPGNTATVSNRTIESTYRFTVTNVNIPGGALPVFDPVANALTTWCVAVDTVSAGAAVKLRTCSGADTQKWSYTSNLWLTIQNSTGTVYCLSAAHSAGAAATLVACNSSSGTDLANITFPWGYDGSKRFEGMTSTSVTGAALNGNCLYAVSLSDGAALKYDSCSSFNTPMIPDSSVGPGRAGTDLSQTDGSCLNTPNTSCTFQLVNYKFFGRCLDMTHQSTSSTWMIGYVCKEAGTNNIAWNQKFVWDAGRSMFCTDTSGTLIGNCGGNSNTLYCLDSGSPSTPSTPGTRVLLQRCSNNDASQKWTRRFDSGTYASSWQIITAREGLCMELSPGYPPEASAIDQPWGMVIVNTCSASTAQKWNAPPTQQGSSVKNIYEQSH